MDEIWIEQPSTAQNNKHAPQFVTIKEILTAAELGTS